MDTIPETALSNIDIERFAKMLNIKHYKGCFMRDELKNLKPSKVECGILNLNLSHEAGSHWVCWYKNKQDRYYFNSFGLPPPEEVIGYLKSPVLYSTFQLQGIGDQNCGKWCLKVLKGLDGGVNYTDLILSFFT